MSKPMVHHNSECIKCSAVNKRMVRVGYYVVFCVPCFSFEFVTDDPVHEEREKYLHWMRLYREKAEVEE